MKQYFPFIVYFLAVSLITALITAIDKYKAKRGSFRISEATLFFLGAIGGALAEYLTMRLIRHKTLHKRFMIGLPLEIALHAAIVCACVYLKFN